MSDVTVYDPDLGLLETWLAQHDDSPHTQRAYERIGRRFLAVLAAPLRSATLEDMRKAFGAISVREDGSPAAGATAAAQIATVKSLLSFGARVRYLQVNLGELFKLKAVPADRARRILSEPDTFILLRSAEGVRDRAPRNGGLRLPARHRARVADVGPA